MSTQPFVVSQLYDSHVHWLATGQVALGLQLQSFRNLADFQKIQISPQFLRREWLVGFGWDENTFASDVELNRQFLDKLFPNVPIMLSRIDGHSSWLNSLALKKLGWMNEAGQLIKIEFRPFLDLDSQDQLVGIAHEKAHMEALIGLPECSPAQIREQLLTAQKIFLDAGITHIRDMTSNSQVWNISEDLEKSGELKLHVEFNFSCENVPDFRRAMSELKAAKSRESKHLKARGIKFFFDGSLGSKTALVQRKSLGVTEGQQLWTNEDVRAVIAETWSEGFEISVHTLGDEAVHRIVQIARELSAKKISGLLNLEHVEVLRNETIQLMKPLHIRCHLQPCHWLADQKWLKERLQDKWAEIFPWERLRVNQIPFFFGSDSPIEIPDIHRNLQALKESASEGIRALGADPLLYHHYPHKDGITTRSLFADGKLQNIEWD